MKARMSIHSTKVDWKTNLIDDIGPDVLPEEYGGTNGTLQDHISNSSTFLTALSSWAHMALGSWALGHLGTWALGLLGSWALEHLQDHISIGHNVPAKKFPPKRSCK
jgi:hypothetical protein